MALTVNVDDLCVFTAEFASGLIGSYFVPKYATGRTNDQRIEAYGSKGALVYNVERPGELEVCLGPEACRARRWSTIVVPDQFGDLGMIGRLEAYRLEQARTFVEGALSRTPVEPTFEDELTCQAILDAVAAATAAPT